MIEEYFDASDWQDDWSPRYNIAPTQSVPVIRQHPKEPVRQITTMRWGLIPNWAKDASSAASTINARSETAATKPAFRDPFKYRRCLIPADAFYEWKRNRASKQPYCFETSDGELFAFAGLWDGWKNAEGQWVKTLEDEYTLLGMAIKYAGLRGKEVRVIGKNRSALGEEGRIQ